MDSATQDGFSELVANSAVVVDGAGAGSSRTRFPSRATLFIKTTPVVVAAAVYPMSKRSSMTSESFPRKPLMVGDAG